MFQEFDKFKKQLLELSKVLNSFQSEAVQLRLLEIIFSESNIDELEDPSDPPAKPRRRKRKQSKKTSKAASVQSVNNGEKGKSKKARNRKGGVAAMLNQLLEEGFFNSQRTLSAIVAHCKEKKATIFKSNQMSPRLASLTKRGILSRKKNSDQQYEYKKN